MQLTLLKGYPDLMGRRRAFAGYGSGPSSYASTGDPLILPGYESYIDAVFGGVAVSGNYYVMASPSAAGARPTWTLYWFYANGAHGGTAGAPVSAATNLSAESVQIGGFWGEY